MDQLTILMLLVFGHLLADYPMQGTFLAHGKNRWPDETGKAGVPGYPSWYLLFVHSGLHAGMVLLFTGSPVLALAELVCHFIIDDRKCARKLTFLQDQALHYICKIVWWLIWLMLGTEPIIG